MHSTIDKGKMFLFLHALFLFGSLGGVAGKLASGFDFLSPRFILYYSISLTILLIYALLWQIILQKIPLSTAFLNKGVVVFWGMLWGFIVFHERLTLAKLIAAVFIWIGVVIIGRSDE
jgi:drug/metabolite transporter (DMT)-like permease